MTDALIEDAPPIGEPPKAEPRRIDHVALDVECHVLGAMLIAPESAKTWHPIMSARWFSSELNAAIYDCIGRLMKAGAEVSIHRLKMMARKQWNADVGLGLTFGGYCERLLEFPTTGDLKYEVDHLRALYTLRVMTSAVTDAAGAGDALEAAREAVARFDDARRSVEPERGLVSSDIGSAASEAMRALEERMMGEESRRVTTGLSRLDHLLSGGFKTGQLVVVSGRPGQGKSTVALHLALAAGRAGWPTHVVSLEMTKEEFANRAISALAYDNRRRLTYHEIDAATDISDDDLNVMHQCLRDLNGLPITVDDAGGLTIAEIEASAERANATLKESGKSLAALIVDHLGIVRAGDRYRGNRVHEIAEITASLKALAKRLGLAVILLCQLNRATESREDKRPLLSDLRDSGSIEQDADIVIGLYREEYYLSRIQEPTDEERARRIASANVLELEILKQRMGPTERVRAFCDIGCNFIANIEARQ